MIPWHVFPIIDIGGFGQKNRRETNLLGGIHKVDNVVGVLEMKPTAAPAWLVRVKDPPSGKWMKCFLSSWWEEEMQPEWDNCWCHEMAKFGQDDPVPEPLLQFRGGGQLLLDALLHPLLRLLSAHILEIVCSQPLNWIESPEDDKGIHNQHFASCPNPSRPPTSAWSVKNETWSAFLMLNLFSILHDKINKNTFVVGQQPPTFRHPHCQGSPQTSSLTLEVWCLHFLIESSLLTCVLVSNLFHQYSGQKFSIWNAKWFLLRLIRLFSNTCITFDEKSIHHTHTIKDAWKAHLYLWFFETICLCDCVTAVWNFPLLNAATQLLVKAVAWFGSLAPIPNVTLHVNRLLIYMFNKILW